MTIAPSPGGASLPWAAKWRPLFLSNLRGDPCDDGDRKIDVALGDGAFGQRGFEAFDKDQADAAGQRAGR